MRYNLVGRLSCAIAVSTLGLAAPSASGGDSGQQILNPQSSLGDLFGISVAAVGSDKVIIGAPGEDVKAGDDGSAYLFDLNGDLLQTYFPQQFEAGEQFGRFVTGVGTDSVLISAFQFTDEAKASLPGRAYLFDLSGTLLDSFINPSSSIGDLFGPSAAIGTDAVVITAPGDDTDGMNTGRAYLFPVGGEGGLVVISNPNPQAGIGFGFPVAAIGTGHVAIGTMNSPELYIFEIPSGNLVTSIFPPFNPSSAVWVEATGQLLVGSEDADDGEVPNGAAYLFDLDTGSLDLTIPNPDPGFDDAFGVNVAVLGNGTLVVAADLDDPFEVNNAGSVYLFDTAGNQLDQLIKLSPTIGDQFGLGLAAVGCNQLAVGTPMGENVAKGVGPGEAWVFSSLTGGNCDTTSNNYVEIFLERIDDFEQSRATFRAEVDVVIPDNPGVLGVQFAVGEVSLFLAQDEDNHWTGSFYFTDLNGLNNNFNGFGLIETFGSASSGGGNFSTTIFTLDTAFLLEADFFATPTDIDPANDATDVPIDSNFSWTDPTGKGTADILAVSSEPQDGGAGSQEDNSLFGSLAVTDTTWDPPQDLLSGANRFEVTYLNFDDAGLASPLSVKSGSISWGNSPIAQKGYPASTALVTLGSSTTIGFGVGSGTVGFDPPDVTPSAGIPEHEATGDFDGDGDTDVVVTIPDLDPSIAGTIQVFLNNGTDEFGEWLGFEALETIPVGREPSWVTVGNFDIDGLPDICVTNAGDDNVSIFLNTGGGTFGAEVNVMTGDGPSSCTTGQFNTNTDFYLDIAVTNANDENLVILFNDGSGGFSIGGGSASSMPPLGLRTAAMTTGDFDGNKCPDAVGAGEAALYNGGVGQVFVLLSNGDGTFQPPIFINVGADPRDISVGDINGDTFNDIIAANRGDATITIVPGLGGGLFDTPITISVGGMPRSVDVINLDSDNDPDIAVVADDPQIGPSVQVLVNRSEDPIGFGSAPFILDTPLSFNVGGDPNFVVHTDLDQDGNSDLCMVNQDGKTEGSVSALLTNLLPEGADCPGDLDGNGFVNIFDFFLLLESWGPCDAPCDADLDGDGEVGIFDFLLLLTSFGPCPGDPCPWDVNDDGVVDFVDLFVVLEHVGHCVDPQNCPWDLDGDGFVGFADALIVLGNFGDCPR